MKTLNIEQITEINGGSCLEALVDYFFDPKLENLIEVLVQC